MTEDTWNVKHENLKPLTGSVVFRLNDMFPSTRCAMVQQSLGRVFSYLVCVSEVLHNQPVVCDCSAALCYTLSRLNGPLVAEPATCHTKQPRLALCITLKGILITLKHSVSPPTITTPLLLEAHVHQVVASLLTFVNFR